MLSADARNEWLTILTVAMLLAVTAIVFKLWWVVLAIIVIAAALIAFFRDPERNIPTHRGIMVAPADGKVSSIHQVDHFEPLGGPATCVRIFLSVFDVHVNRAPCHGLVTHLAHKPGKHLNALNPDSAEVNESNLIVLHHPIRRYPVAAVRQVAGLCARTICCNLEKDQTVQRGQRIGIIKLGSTTELYIPNELKPQVQVSVGQKVKGGETVLAHITAVENQAGMAKTLGVEPEEASEQEPSNQIHV